MIKIAADTREIPGGVPGILEELGAEVEVKMLEIGDFHISDELIVERKTTSDFLHSILNDRGHMFGQLADMCREYKRSVLIIEGDLIDLYTKRAVHPNAIDGMILAAARFQTSMIWTLSADHTARMIYREAEHEQIQMAKKKGSPHGKRSSMTMPQRQIYVVASIGDGVGPVVAEALLKHFHSVQAVMNASIDEMTKVEGIGKKTAEKIREIVGGEYKV